MKDRSLCLGQPGKVSSHIIKEDREAIDSPGVEELDSASQCLPGFVVEGAVNLIGAQADSNLHSQLVEAVGELSEAARLLPGIRLPPGLAEEGIALGRVHIKTITVVCQGPE